MGWPRRCPAVGAAQESASSAGTTADSAEGAAEDHQHTDNGGPSQLSGAVTVGYMRSPEGILSLYPLSSLHPLQLLGCLVGYCCPALFLLGQLGPWGVSGGSTFTRYQRCGHIPGPGCMSPSVLTTAFQDGEDGAIPNPALGHGRDRHVELSAVCVWLKGHCWAWQPPEPCPDGFVTWSPGGVQDPFLGATLATPWCCAAELVAMAPGTCSACHCPNRLSQM